MSPASLIRFSMMSEPCLKCLTEARIFALTASWTSASRSYLRSVASRPLYRRSDQVDDRPQIPRLVLHGPLQLRQGRLNGAALRMTQDDDEPGAELLGSEFDAADLRRCDDIARRPV